MKKLMLAAVAALGAFSVANAEVLTGTYNSGRDEETENSSSMDMRMGACPGNSSQTCGTALRVVDASGSTMSGVEWQPSKNFRPNGSDSFGPPALVLTGLEYVGVKDGNKRWEDGLFYNPATGKEFNGVFVEQLPNGNLDVGGCVLVFCQSTTFTKR